MRFRTVSLLAALLVIVACTAPVSNETFEMRATMPVAADLVIIR